MPMLYASASRPRLGEISYRRPEGANHPKILLGTAARKAWGPCITDVPAACPMLMAGWSTRRRERALVLLFTVQPPQAGGRSRAGHTGWSTSCTLSSNKLGTCVFRETNTARSCTSQKFRMHESAGRGRSHCARVKGSVGDSLLSRASEKHQIVMSARP